MDLHDDAVSTTKRTALSIREGDGHSAHIVLKLGRRIIAATTMEDPFDPQAEDDPVYVWALGEVSGWLRAGKP